MSLLPEDMVKTFLFVIVDAGGNVSSQMSIARRLAARGHSVHVLGDCGVEPEAARASCIFQRQARNVPRSQGCCGWSTELTCRT